MFALVGALFLFFTLSSPYTHTMLFLHNNFAFWG